MREAQAFAPVLPTTLQAELRGYQEEGFSWLNRLSHWGVGACLADDMGLGKTVQALAQILSMAAKGPSLVVAPTSVCLNWESEATNSRRPCTSSCSAPATGEPQGAATFRPRGLQLRSPAGRGTPGGGQLAGHASDEAQAIKNLATKRSQAAMKLSGAFKMVATGTPIENHLESSGTSFASSTRAARLPEAVQR